MAAFPGDASADPVDLSRAGIATAAQFRGDEPYPRIHDPSTVVVEGKDLWCVATGNGVNLVRREADGRWKRETPLFREYPAWHQTAVPENKGHLWAPDILRIGDKWFVYYSVSSFGSFWEGGAWWDSIR